MESIFTKDALFYLHLQKVMPTQYVAYPVGRGHISESPQTMNIIALDT